MDSKEKQKAEKTEKLKRKFIEEYKKEHPEWDGVSDIQKLSEKYL